ncbi:hypothetical protein M5689_010948 [Euphorbia peplus]|nr:hypothetical protein M5689_010948 [Euphorbia peplus]
MDCLFWNVCGTANMDTCLHLKDMLRLHKPTIFALLETKVSGSVADRIIGRFRGWQCVMSEAQGCSGGIWVFWRDFFVQVKVLQIHHQFVHCEVSQNGKFVSLLSLIYASPCITQRNSLWDNLISLSLNIDVPWLLMADFNDIGTIEDQRGGSSHYSTCAINHKTLMEDCGLIDFGFAGARYTWRRWFLSVRLDKVYGNVCSRNDFLEASVINLPFCNSDHAPVLFKMNGLTGKKELRPFRYLMSWEEHIDFVKVIDDSWSRAPHLVVAANEFKTKVMRWNKKVFGNVFAKKKKFV